MDTIQLAQILSSDPQAAQIFYGVRPCNHLPSHVNKVPSCMIVNSDPSWKSGAHWLAIYIDENRNVEFFDSYGRDPETYRLIFDFLKRHGETWKLNKRQLQGHLSSTCGQFCLYFLLWRSRGISFEKILSSFGNSLDANDILVTAFVNSLANRQTKVYDADFVINQCCKRYLASF